MGVSWGPQGCHCELMGRQRSTWIWLLHFNKVTLRGLGRRSGEGKEEGLIWIHPL